MKAAIIGAGNMGSAIARGMAKGSIVPATSITVSNPSQGKLDRLKAAFPALQVTRDNRAAGKGADMVILAVKPWILPDVVEELRDTLDYDKQEVAAIVAGVSGEELKGMFRKADGYPDLSVVMPNTAMVLRESMTFVVEVVGGADRAVKAFSLLGKVMKIEEKLLPAATALASCGIAYAMRYVRAAVEGGVELGFRASEAQAIVVETLKGAASLLALPGVHPESEIDKVTTPGGITIKGLNAMEQAGFSASVIAGLKAGRAVN